MDNSEKLQTNGPGKLCRYLEIDKSYDRLSLFKKSSNVWISDGEVISPQLIKAVPRVGIDYAGEAIRWPLRFYVSDNRFVSR